MEKVGFLIIGFIIATSVYADIIYDGQTYDLGATWDAYNFGSGLADDFEVPDDCILTGIRIWVTDSPPWDIYVSILGSSTAGPGETLYTDLIQSDEATWLDTGDDFGGYTVLQVDGPLTGFEIEGGTKYWLSINGAPYQSRWLVMPNQPEWWENCYIYFWDGFEYIWADSFYYYGEASACEFELHGTLESEDPEVTETFPHDSDFPSGVPVNTDITFHVTDDLSGCDTDETTCTVEESGGPLSGALTFDDSDPLDVSFTWDPDDDYAEGASINVEVVTYDLAGNGPVTEEWTFTTGYVNILPASLGVIKGGFS
jgi:hypothetical protein